MTRPDGNRARALAKKGAEQTPEAAACWNYLFLAMAHWQMDQKAEAHRWYDQAVQWMAKNKPQDEELRRFRAEAPELLGMKDKKD